jgi:tetratricopeptide (TPR) repeat protein
VRVLGAVPKPAARRQAERLRLDLKLWWDPRDAEARFQRGWLWAQENRWREALEDFREAVRLRPDRPEAHRWLADAYLHQGDRPAALAALGKHLERAPADAGARLQHGLLALDLGQAARAVDDFTRVLAAEPQRASARYRRAQALLRLGRPRDALADVEALLKDSPREFSLHQMRSQIHERLGDHRQALADLEKARGLRPNDPRLLNNLAWGYVTGPVASRDPTRALPLARKAVELAPNEALYRSTLGVVLYRLGRYREATAVLEKSLTLGKGKFDGFDLFFLAMCHARLGERTRARECFDRAVRWQSKQKGLAAEHLAELKAFRAEAEAVLRNVPPTK